jgi:glucose-1-phosphatase
LTGIKNIIFDLGNVVLNISYEATIEAFKQLGIANFNEVFSKEKQNPLADDFEKGLVEPDYFLSEMQKLCTSGTTITQVTDAWNAIILNFPIRRLQLLQQINLHYRTFCLSNTNHTHEIFYNKLLQETCGHPSLDYFFDKVYLSHHIHARKPEPKAWEIIIEENKLVPSQTLFLDDSPQHIAAASKLGLQTIHITPENSMEDVFKAKA